MELDKVQIFILIFFIICLSIISDFISDKQISKLEQQVQELQKIDTSKVEQNKNFIQFCQQGKLIFILGGR